MKVKRINYIDGGHIEVAIDNCPKCGAIVESGPITWDVYLNEKDDIPDGAVASFTCPKCGTEWTEQFREIEVEDAGDEIVVPWYDKKRFRKSK